MANNLKHRCTVLAGVFLTLHPWALAADVPRAPALVVVVNQSSTAYNLSISDLRQMVDGGLRFWPDSSPVFIVEQTEESATQRHMLQALLKTTPAGYKRQLLQMQFQGREPPVIKVLNSDETAIKFVRNVPGAVAVVSASTPLAARSSVKVLRINGKLPDETGYPLQ